MKNAGLPGAAVVVVQDSQVIFKKCFGVKKVGSRDSINSATLFRLASLSKGFTGVLAGMLSQDSLFELEAPVRRYCPEFQLRDARQAARVRIWHLLSHTSGLPYHAFTNLVEDGMETSKIVRDYFPRAKLGGKEGEFFAYQNVAICLAAAAMEQAAGKSYPQLLQERIFQPLHMKNAACTFESMAQNPNAAQPHLPAPEGWAADQISKMYYNAVAAGGINASIDDMGEWLQLLLGNRPDLIAERTLDRVFSPVVETGAERRFFSNWLKRNELHYALGWRVLTPDDGSTIIYHGGYANGFKSEIAFDRRRRLGICVLMNGFADWGAEVVPLVFK